MHGMMFQSTRPRGARPGRQQRGATGMSFNPRAREGRDLDNMEIEPGQIIVSIHAPARGATADVVYLLLTMCVSIHAPARGATEVPCPHCGIYQRFNPRAREGRDASSASILQLYKSFQSTRPRGARRTAKMERLSPMLFQSTRPRGARPASTFRNVRRSCFNPRAREGRDAKPSTLPENPQQVSIHAPARGATKSPIREIAAMSCFNPRAREGRDRSSRMPAAHPTCFNPRAREGRDREWLGGPELFCFVSIHAPARGATSVDQAPCLQVNVSIHAPARGATANRLRGRSCGLFQSTRPRGARPRRSRH